MSVTTPFNEPLITTVTPGIPRSSSGEITRPEIFRSCAMAVETVRSKTVRLSKIFFIQQNIIYDVINYSFYIQIVIAF